MRVQALRLALLVETAVVVVLWMWVWRSLQSHAWIGGGVETDLTERGLSYLLVLAPAIPVNLLAVAWLGRGGRRAQIYLVAAGALAATQLILLLTPVDPGGSIAAGLVFAMTAGPVAFVAVALAVPTASKNWLRTDHRTTRRTIATAETLVWGLTVVMAIGVATSVGEWVEASSETGPPIGEYDESDVWARMEDSVTAAVSLPDFPGFASRTVEVASCGYRTASGLQTYRYWISYELAPFESPLIAEDYVGAVRENWSADEYEILYDGSTFEGDVSITAHRHDELTLFLKLGERAALTVESDCLERVDAYVPCLDAQGGVHAGADQITGIRCTDEE